MEFGFFPLGLDPCSNKRGEEGALQASVLVEKEEAISNASAVGHPLRCLFNYGLDTSLEACALKARSSELHRYRAITLGRERVFIAYAARIATIGRTSAMAKSRATD